VITTKRAILKVFVCWAFVSSAIAASSDRKINRHALVTRHNITLTNPDSLTPVAMMTAGWTGCPPRPTPGFPDNGQWNIRWEGLRPIP